MSLTKLLLLAVALLLPFNAFGAEVITTVEEGEIVPFTGTLLSTEAAAKIMTQLDFSEEACKLEMTRAVESIKIVKDGEIDSLKIKLDTAETLCQQRIEIRDEQIDFLSKELMSQKKPNTALWFAGGTIAGIGLTVLSGWAIGQAASQ